MLSTGILRRYVIARTGLAVGMAAISFSANAVGLLWAALVVALALASATSVFVAKGLRNRTIATVVGDLLLAVWLVPATGGNSSPFIVLAYLAVVLCGVGVSPRAALWTSAVAAALWLATLFIGPAPADGNTLFGIGIREPEFVARVCTSVAFLFLTAVLSGYLGVFVQRRTQLLRQVEQDLHETHLKTDVIVESLSQGLISVGRDRQVSVLNTEGRKTLGIETPLSSTDVGELLVGRLAPVRTELLGVLESGHEDRRVIVRVQDRLLGFHVMPVVKDQEMVGVVGVFRDVTDDKEAEKRRRRQDRLAAIGALSAGIVHELRNTLKPLAGAVELLEGDLDPKGDQAALIRLIREETDSLERFLSQFLEFAGDGRLDMKSFMIGDLVEEVVERVRSHDACRGLTVRAEGNLDIRVEGDRQALRRLFMNMAMNAAEHRPDGQFVICVRDVGDGEMLIQLSDDGPGISLADRNRVFDPFYTTKRGGTGLGLAIVKRTVERHGGKISVGDSPLGGARFEIRIPIEAMNDNEFDEAA